MMRLIKAVLAVLGITLASAAFADAHCEAGAKTRGDFLACSEADTERNLSDADKMYRRIREGLGGKKRDAVDANNELWKKRIQSDCTVFALAFNNWTDSYAPDTDFQAAACRAKIAERELEFYEWLSCPEDMESSPVAECKAVKEALGIGAQSPGK